MEADLANISVIYLEVAKHGKILPGAVSTHYLCVICLSSNPHVHHALSCNPA